MGIPWLARAIDKGRMRLGNGLGDYVFPCPMDEEILRRLSLSPDQFLAILEASSGDGEVLQALSHRISSLGPGDWMALDVFLVRHSRLIADQDREEGRL
ncbi:MAG: DUF5069 domain-containing protein [Nitrospirae bacterium]|jgi:hypothetical protein|nr:DUF5069 domain-containing protein [Nitrospirota bacterium]MCL5285004.1 DUF5069 domain-containing protein [Nitrospirota bacterium]